MTDCKMLIKVFKIQQVFRND